MILIPFKKVVEPVYVALSGGVDSVSVCHSLHKRDKLKAAIWFDHENHTSKQEKEFVRSFTSLHGMKLIEGNQDNIKYLPKKNSSKEAQWSNLRNAWFQQFDAKVVVAHTLSDAAEWFLLTAMRGEGHYMAYQNRNVIRPFLTLNKKDMFDYVKKHGLTYFHDETNDDVNFTYRNRVRHEILPSVLKINEGFMSTVRRNIIRKNNASV